MNHVDQADQLRSYNISLRRIQKGWRALFQFIFNVVLVNSYLLAHHTMEARFRNQFQFRTALIDALINKSTPTIQQPMGRKRPRPIDIIPTNKPHARVRMERVGDCAECRKKIGAKRVALASIDGNKVQFRHGKRSQYGCEACGISLCKEGSCFGDFHAQMAV